MDWTTAVIEMCILFSYAIAYVNLWPMWQKKTKSRYKILCSLDIIMIIILAILKAPSGAMKIIFAILIKDIIVFFWRCDE